MNIGGGEGLTVQPDGDAVLDAAGGALTSFVRNEHGNFESPKGDSNLALKAEERESGKGITAYVLSDATTGTSTRFEQPSGTQSTAPAFAEEFGDEYGQLNDPTGESVDANGDVWVSNHESGLVEEFSPGGTLIASYGCHGTCRRTARRAGGDRD